MCYSDPDLRNEGQLIQSWLLSKADDPVKRPISYILIRLLSVPVGAVAAREVLTQAAGDPSARWLMSPSPMPRHAERDIPYITTCPNVWLNAPPVIFRTISWMLKQTERSGAFRRAFGDELEQPLPEKLTVGRLFDAFESILPLQHPPALIAALNWSLDVAWPTNIDLESLELSVGRNTPRNQRESKYPKLGKILRVLKRARTERIGVSEEDFTAPARLATGIEYTVCKIVVRDLLGKYRSGLPRSQERIYQALPIVAEAAVNGVRPKYVGPVESEAFKMLRKLGHGLLPPEIINRAVPMFSMLDPQPVRRMELSSPDAIDSHFGLRMPFPPVDADEECGLRFMLIVMARCGRRACDLIDVKIDSLTEEGPFLDLTIPSTKVASQNEIDLPLHVFFYPEELEFTKRWLQSLVLRGVSKQKTLFELLGVERQTRANSDKTRGFLVSKLNSKMLRAGVRSTTHLPRHSFASWWPVICLIARYRFLRDHEILTPVRDSRVFSDEYLDQVLSLVTSGADSSSLHANLAMGHSQATELFYSYCRSWPLLIVLHAAIAQSSSRREVVERAMLATH